MPKIAELAGDRVSHLSPNLHAVLPKRNKCASGQLSPAHRSQETLGLSHRKWMTSASLLVSQTMGKAERARDWPKVSSCASHPHSRTSLSPAAPRRSWGKTFRDIPGEDSWKAGVQGL